MPNAKTQRSQWQLLARGLCLSCLLVAQRGYAADTETPTDAGETSSSAAVAAASDNAVLKKLIEVGVPVSPTDFALLPPPTMPDNLDAAAQHAIIEEVGAPRRSVADLTRRSVVAPFVLDVETLDQPTGDVRGRRIDLWFVAYGDLESLASREFLEELAGASASGPQDDLPTSWRLLEEDEIEARGLDLVSLESTKELIFHGTFPLLDRVLIRATRRSMFTQTDDSLLLAASLDPRFVDDAEYPNLWRPITLDDLGQPELGEATTYLNGGFYLKVTALEELPRALFIEYHQAFAEPKAWFRGANLLRSKLPLIVQDTVRKFRRKMDR